MKEKSLASSSVQTKTLEELRTSSYDELTGVLGDDALTARFYLEKWTRLLSAPGALPRILEQMRHDPPSTYTFYDGPTHNAVVVVDLETQSLIVTAGLHTEVRKLASPDLPNAPEPAERGKGAGERKTLAVVVNSAIDEQMNDYGVVLLDPAIVPALESFAAFATELQEAGMVEATSATQRAFLEGEHLYPLEGPWAAPLEGGDRPASLIELPDALPAPIGDVADVSVTVSQTGDLTVEVLEGRSGATYLSDPFDLYELRDAD